MTATDPVTLAVEAAYDHAQQVAAAAVEAECARVLRRCPSLARFFCGMGTMFFVRTDGQIVHNEDDLPPTAQAFLNGPASAYVERFSTTLNDIHR